MGLLGLDNYYETLLNEAKSPEEIKKILDYQYVQNKNVPQDVLDSIFEIDPTKKKTYTRWTLNFWEENQKEILNALKMGKLKEMFDYFKERSVATEDNPKGLSLVDMKSFQQAMNMLPDADPIFGTISNNPKYEDYDIVFDLPGVWRIAVPHTFEADKKLGQGCRWCTAGAFGNPNDPHYWDYYSKEGPLWVNFDFRGKEVCPMDNKEYPYRRYQFLFEHNQFGGELCDCHDRRVDFDKMKMPEEVIDFYSQQDERYGMICQGLDIKNKARNEFLKFRREHIIDLKHFDNDITISIKLGPSMEDFTNGIRRYFVFSSEDEQDPIVEPNEENSVDPEDYIDEEASRKLSGCNNALVVKLKRGALLFVYLDDNTVSRKIIGNEEILPLENRLIFFYGTNENNTFFRCYDDEEKLLTTIAAKGNNNISIIKSTKLTDGCYALEFVNEDNRHILVTIQNNCLSDVLENDEPINGQYYKIEKEGDYFYVNGKHFKHWLFGENDIINQINDNTFTTDDDFAGDNCSVLEELSANVYLVQTDNGQYNNLYNPQTKKFYSNKWFTRILNPIDGTRLLTCVTDTDLFTIGKCLFDLDSLKFVTPLLSRARNTHDYFYGFVENSNILNLYEFSTKQTYTLDNVEDVYPVRTKRNDFITLRNTDNKIIIWYFKQNKISLDDLDVENLDWEPTVKYNTPHGLHYLYRASVNGKTALLDLVDGTVVIDSIKRIELSPDEKWVIVYNSNGYTTFDDDGNIFVQDAEYVNYTSSYLVYLNDDGTKIICVNQDGQTKCVLNRPQGVNIDVDYHRNNILLYYGNARVGIYNIDTGEVVGTQGNLTPEDVYSSINAQTQVVRENFKKIYNKLFG